jgi:hypothetical protein
MDSTSIKPEHAAQINKSLFRSVNYLYRLRQRMRKVGFAHDDPLLQLVEQAYDAMHKLFVKTHYLSCPSGAGLLPRNTGEAQPGESGSPPDARY